MDVGEKISESFDGRDEVNAKNRWNDSLPKHYSDYASAPEENSQFQKNQKIALKEDEKLAFPIFQENIKRKQN
jgi:hypothetical protein